MPKGTEGPSNEGEATHPGRRRTVSLTQNDSTSINDLDLQQLEDQFKQEMPDNLVRIDGGSTASYWQSSEGAQTAKDAAEEFFRTMSKLPGVDACMVQLEHAGASSLTLMWAKDPSTPSGLPESGRMPSSSSSGDSS